MDGCLRTKSFYKAYRELERIITLSNSCKEKKRFKHINATVGIIVFKILDDLNISIVSTPQKHIYFKKEKKNLIS